MAQFPFRSMREWITFLDERGELLRISEPVDLRGEVAALAQSVREMRGPAVLCDNVKGYPGWRLAFNTLGTEQRLAWASGLDRVDLHELAPVVDRLAPPMQVSTGPCKELKFFGDEIDLTKIPIPYTGRVEYEGSPNITSGVSNKMDPETSWQNVAVRKVGVKGKRTLSEPINPMGQASVIWSKYRIAKKKMPVAIVISPDPCVYMISGAKPKPGICEYEIWGGFTGLPIELVKCETSDILVPAHAEMIIEGVVDPEERELDGPFSEYSGYFTRISATAKIEVTCVTMRRDPIYYYMYMGMHPTEGHDVVGLMFAATALRELSSMFPGILDVYTPNFGAVVIVKVDKRFAKGWPDFAKRIGQHLKSNLAPYIKGVIVVDDDIHDIRNLEHITNAIVAKFQASKDLTVIPRTTGTLSEPSEPWAGQWGWTDFFIMDCTEPPPPWDEGFLRGVSVPAPESTVRARELLEKALVS